MSESAKIILMATGNEGKLKEIQKLLPEDFNIKSIKQLDEKYPDFEENGETFRSNSEGKALYYNELTGLPTLADDSGLVVASLGGAPGVYSARWAGEAAADSDLITKLLNEMKDVPYKERSARFVCSVSFADKGKIIKTVEDFVEGTILDSTQGNQGFGYDPVFYHEEIAKTFAQISSDEKNKISHRGKAFRAMAKYLKNEYY